MKNDDYYDKDDDARRERVDCVAEAGKPTTPTAPTPKFVFVAVYPRDKKVPAYLNDLAANGWNVLHPAYNWDTPEGRGMQNLIKAEKAIDLPMGNDQWAQASMRDYFAIRAADVAIYDSDSEPGPHFLTAAQIYGVPVIAVSAILTSIPPYFSGSVMSVVKPQDILSALQGL